MTTTDPLALVLSPAGWELLGKLPPFAAEDALRVGTGLRERGVDSELVAAVMTQLQLRSRAAEKFGDFATQMVFTTAGLEQATRLRVAAHHAARYRNAGCTCVADLGCGIGGDAMALAGLGLAVRAVDSDEATAAAATMNLRFFPTAQVIHADAREVDLVTLGVDGVFADPARRRFANGRWQRLKDPEQWSPALSTVLGWREQVPAVGMKLGPGIETWRLPTEGHAQWVEDERTTVEAGLWFGDLAPEGPGRSALVIRAGVARTLRDAECSDPSQPHAQASESPLGRYLFEPVGAAIRAGLVARLAAEVGGGVVAPDVAYLTSDQLPTAEMAHFLRCFEVLEVVSLHTKKIQAALRHHNIGALEIRKRGVDLVPDQLRGRLQLKGDHAGVLIATRLGRRRGAVIARPCPPPLQ